MNNVYTEEFRINAVAVVRAGIPLHALAVRLMIPETSIRNWMSNPKYAEIGPANSELLKQITEETSKPTQFVQITNTGLENNRKTDTFKIKAGKVDIEIPNGCSKSTLVNIFSALGEAGVL